MAPAKKEMSIPIYNIIEKQMKSLSSSSILDLLREKMEGAPKAELNQLLCSACGSNKWPLQLIECIIEAGADPNCAEDEPFLRSCECHGADFTIPAYFLNEHNADINAQDGCAFERAFMCYNFICAEKLLEFGFIIKDLNDVLTTIDYKQDKLIEILTRNGFDPEVIVRTMLVSSFKSQIYDNDKENPFYTTYVQAKKYLSKEELGQLLVETVDKTIDGYVDNVSYSDDEERSYSRQRSRSPRRSLSTSPIRSRSNSPGC